MSPKNCWISHLKGWRVVNQEALPTLVIMMIFIVFGTFGDTLMLNWKHNIAVIVNLVVSELSWMSYDTLYKVHSPHLLLQYELPRSAEIQGRFLTSLLQLRCLQMAHTRQRLLLLWNTNTQMAFLIYNAQDKIACHLRKLRYSNWW